MTVWSYSHIYICYNHPKAETGSKNLDINVPNRYIDIDEIEMKDYASLWTISIDYTSLHSFARTQFTLGRGDCHYCQGRQPN
jgi:hypothetical protein